MEIATDSREIDTNLIWRGPLFSEIAKLFIELMQQPSYFLPDFRQLSLNVAIEELLQEDAQIIDPNS